MPYVPYMSVCVCLSTKICFNPRVTLIPTLQCDAVQMHLVCCLSVCPPDWLSHSLSLSLSVSFSVAHYSSIRRDCEFTAQVARDNKRQQMEKKGKQAQMSTSNRKRERERVIEREATLHRQLQFLL